MVQHCGSITYDHLVSFTRVVVSVDDQQGNLIEVEN